MAMASGAEETVSIEMLRAVYEERYARFLVTARGILGDHERAHDAVQEAFARAVARRGELRAPTLVPWLWRVLTNLCLSDRRFHAIPGLSELEFIAGPDGDPVEWPDLTAAVAALPPRQRAAVFLRHYADLDYNEIAGILGIERGTVAATLSAAHARLRVTLALDRKE